MHVAKKLHVSFCVSFIMLAEPCSSVLEIQLFQPTQPCCWPCPGVPRRLWQVGTEQGVAGGAEAFQASTGCPLLFLRGVCSQSTAHSTGGNISWGNAAAAPTRCLLGHKGCREMSHWETPFSGLWSKVTVHENLLPETPGKAGWCLSHL